MEDRQPRQAIAYAYHNYAITQELEPGQEASTDLGFDHPRRERSSQTWHTLERIQQRIPNPFQELKRRTKISIPKTRRATTQRTGWRFGAQAPCSAT
ncbi:hypothetical protein KBY96_06495 [Cyanobium sp. ATX 6A2]|nr:hypothetical protein [Cyanobium sp. ATX 6A2]